jgi:hypothetical protein
VLAEGRLYQFVRQLDPVRKRLLEITFHETGAEASAFTLGEPSESIGPSGATRQAPAERSAAPWLTSDSRPQGHDADERGKRGDGPARTLRDRSGCTSWPSSRTTTRSCPARGRPRRDALPPGGPGRAHRGAGARRAMTELLDDAEVRSRWSTSVSRLAASRRVGDLLWSSPRISSTTVPPGS